MDVMELWGFVLLELNKSHVVALNHRNWFSNSRRSFWCDLLGVWRHFRCLQILQTAQEVHVFELWGV